MDGRARAAREVVITIIRALPHVPANRSFLSRVMLLVGCETPIVRSDFAAFAWMVRHSSKGRIRLLRSLQYPGGELQLVLNLEGSAARGSQPEPLP